MSEKSRSLRQEIVEAESMPLRHDIVAGDNIERRSLAPESASQAITFAALMAKSKGAVPAMFRENQGLCLGVTMDAMMLGVNPFALARSAYEVSGTIGYEAKVYAAALNTSRFLKKRLRIEYRGEIKGTHKIATKSGTRDAPAGTLVCKVIGELVGEDTPFEWETPELGAITTKNSPLWYSDPKLQLYYYAVRAWARVHVPEAMLGVRSTDELADRDEPDEKPAPRQTLIERVKARREAEPEPEPDAAIVAKALDKGAAEVTDAQAEPVNNDPPPVETATATEAPEPAEAAPKPKRTRKAKDTPKSEPAKAEPAQSEAPPPEEAEPTTEEVTPREGDPVTTEAALTALRAAIEKCETRDAIEEARLDWLQSIQHFSREEQFDLIAEGDMLRARAVLDLRKKKAPSA